MHHVNNTHPVPVVALVVAAPAVGTAAAGEVVEGGEVDEELVDVVVAAGTPPIGAVEASWSTPLAASTSP